MLKRVLDPARNYPVIANQPLPKTLELDLNHQLSCPASPEEFADYANDTPSAGMPYGTAPLSELTRAHTTDPLAVVRPPLFERPGAAPLIPAGLFRLFPGGCSNSVPSSRCRQATLWAG
ncbi:MAG: hypothetical protein GY916_03465 [Gammaproteobacteria bacterium]|nr:hypothetical protein [Gammaproteobacteria bacterium]